MRLKLGKYFSILLILIIFLIGLSFFLIQFFSYAVFKAKVDSIAPDSNAIFFSVRYFETLKLYEIIAGVFIISIAGLSVIFIKKIQLFLSNLAGSFLSFFKEVITKVKIFATEEHKVHLVSLVIIFIFSFVVNFNLVKSGGFYGTL